MEEKNCKIKISQTKDVKGDKEVHGYKILMLSMKWYNIV